MRSTRSEAFRTIQYLIPAGSENVRMVRKLQKVYAKPKGKSSKTRLNRPDSEGSKISGLFYMQSYFHWLGELKLFKETKIQNKNRLAAVKEARYLDFFITDLDYK